MKVRTGFVSNSSSSSFIIAAKEKPTKETLFKLFRQKKGDFFYKVSEQFAEIMAKCELIPLKDYDDYSIPGDFIDAAQENGMKIYIGYASNDGEPLENALCEIPIDYTTDDLMVFKEEGY